MTSPFLETYRQFPVGDDHNLEKQLINAYVSSSTAINNRTISTFDLHVVGNDDAIPNGERWYPASGQQRLRDGNRMTIQVSDSVLVVAHNIPLINKVTRWYGTFFDGTFWWPLPYVDLVSVTNQINISVSSTQVIVTKGAGSPPSIVSGDVVLEYI
jgi:hypothetical protein